MATTAVDKLVGKLNFAQVILDGLRDEMKARESDLDFRKSDRLYYEALMKYYSDIVNARKEGKTMVLHDYLAPIEVFHAMDIVPMSGEFCSDMATAYAGVYAQGIGVRDFRSAATSHGFPVEICGAHSSTDGIALLRLMPRPDAACWTSQVCDNCAKSGRDLMRVYNCPGYFLDHPYKQSPKEIAYYINELKGCLHFLEDLTGKKLDYERLRETVRLSEEAMSLWHDIYELKKNDPFPSRNIDVFQNLMLPPLKRGTPEAVEYFKASKLEMEELVKAGKGAVPNVRHRVLIVTFIPSYAIELLSWMEKEFGAVMVIDPLSSWSYWEEYGDADPLEILSRRSFTMPGARQYGGPFDWSIEDLIINAREFKIDSAICLNHLGCRQITPLTKTLKDTLEEQTGIPMLVVDIDAYDSSVAPVEFIKEKIEGYFEMLEG